MQFLESRHPLRANRRVLPCVREHRIGGNYHLQTARAEILRNLVDGEKDSTVMERRSRHDKAVPDCILKAQAFPNMENNAE